ncbi:subtilisin-like serine protease pr1c [Colletotrichum truncatum]|uniref:Subtilisin-like serine protease pr1c n=1 Tax=Colletotrichum truncatum TaxID=5467 RepID=A0ACC3YFQ9_COLTU|nr:subtilisin-like serine protease pr1c [Colletotrichum truncatum]KAF6788403.1 subtilisin-like serine protease pr1c [Colletotrichum truncatum]
MTGVDKLHQQNITGQGVTIALIDSGLDYLHPGLGGGFGTGFKVSGGYDLVGDDWKRGLPANPSADPYTECSFHGTHTSGIAAGNDTRTGYVGAAPGANIHHYRIIGCDTRNTLLDSDIITKAILMAYENGAEVISISLSLSKGPYPDDPVSEILSRITTEGRTVCVVAVGNNGPNGTFSADAPASAKGVLSVGTVNSLSTIESRPRARMSLVVQSLERGNSDTAISNETMAEFMWTPATPKGRFPEKIEVLSLGLLIGKEFENACKLFNSSIALPSSVVILVRRGGCGFSEKLQNVANAGGRYVLIYDDQAYKHQYDNPDDLSQTMDQLLEFENNTPGIHAAGFVSAETAETWLTFASSAAQSNSKMLIYVNMDSNLTFTPFFACKPPSLAPGRINGKSTWGPSGDASIMPLVVAPGGNMVSTLPRSWGGYGVLSGSSMAAPYVAGCVALLKQARPELKAREIVNLLATTAMPVQFSDGTTKDYHFLSPVWHQGGGLIQPSAAVEASVLPDVPNVSFNDSDFFVGVRTFEVRNIGTMEVLYDLFAYGTDAKTSYSRNTGLGDLSLSAATVLSRWPSPKGGFVSWGWKSPLAEKQFLETVRGPLEYSDLHASVVVKPNSLRLKPGQSANVSITVTGLNNLTSPSVSARCPLWGGYIAMRSAANTSDNDAQPKKNLTHFIAYGGVACALRDIVVLADHSTDNGRASELLSSNYTSSNYTEAKDDNKDLSIEDPQRLQGTFLAAATEADQYSPKFVATPISSMDEFTIPSPQVQSVAGFAMTGKPASRGQLPLLPTLNLKFDLSTRALTIDVQMLKNATESVNLGPAFSHEVTRRPGGFNRANNVYQPWHGQLADGTWVDAGIYRFRVCALRTWGNMDKPQDYRDCVETEAFQLNYDSDRQTKDLSKGMEQCGFFDEKPLKR